MAAPVGPPLAVSCGELARGGGLASLPLAEAVPLDVGRAGPPGAFPFVIASAMARNSAADGVAAITREYRAMKRVSFPYQHVVLVSFLGVHAVQVVVGFAYPSETMAIDRLRSYLNWL